MTVEPGWAADRVVELAGARTEEGVFVGPRTKLITAGQVLLFERGNTSYTIEELVRRAGVAIKTFYRCFDTKDDFLKDVFTALVAESTPRFRERVFESSDDPLARLRTAVTWPLQWHREDDATSRILAIEHMRMTMVSPDTIAASSRPFWAMIHELIVGAAEAGRIHPADPEWDARIITSIVTTAFHTLILGLDDSDPRTLADNVWRFCLSALGGPAPD